MAPLNENSATIFQMGANLVTSALPEEHKADMQMLGQGVGQILRNRFLQQQADDFKNNELAAFQEASAQFGQRISMIEDPNQQVQALMDYKNSVMLPFITNTSMKYQNNDIIMNTAKMVFEMGPQLKDYISAGGLAQEGERLEIDRMRAETDRLQAQTQAGMLQRQMKREELMGPIDPTLPSSEIAQRLRNLPREERESLDADTLEMVATAYARSRGVQYDHQRRQQWNTTFRSFKDADGNIIEGDLDRAKSELSAHGDLLKRILFVGRGIEKLGVDKMKEKFPDQFTDIYPYFTGAIEKAPEIEMKGNVPDNVIAGVFTNTIKPQDLTLDQFMEEIKGARRPEDLGDRFFSTMHSAIRRDGRVLFRGGTDERLTFSNTDYAANRKKLRGLLREQMNEQILNRLVSNDKSSLTTRRKLERVLDAAVDRFIDEYADDYDIPVKALRPTSGRTRTEVYEKDFEKLDRQLGGLLSTPSSTGGIF